MALRGRLQIKFSPCRATSRTSLDPSLVFLTESSAIATATTVKLSQLHLR